VRPCLIKYSVFVSDFALDDGERGDFADDEDEDARVDDDDARPTALWQ
jgi:hypothetical protein